MPENALHKQFTVLKTCKFRMKSFFPVGVTRLAGVKHTLSNRCPSQAVAPEWIKGRRCVQRSTTKLLFSLPTSLRSHQKSTFQPGVCLARYNLVTPDSWYHPTIP